MVFAGTNNVTKNLSELKLDEIGDHKLLKFIYYENVKIIFLF